MTPQTALNYVYSALCGVIVYILTQNIEAVKIVNQNLHDLQSELSQTKLLIVQSYITKAEYERKHDALMESIEKLNQSLYEHNLESHQLLSTIKKK